MSSDAAHYEQNELWGEDQVFLAGAVAERIAAIVDLVPVGAGTVLDVGAGDGRVLHALATRDAHRPLVAVERSRTALRLARTLQVQASADRLPVRSRCAETTICSEVLEHLPSPVYSAALDELARTTDRWLVLTVPNRERRRRSDVTCRACGCRYNRERHLRSFTPATMAALLPSFDLIRTVEVGPRPPIYPASVRTRLEHLGLLQTPGAPTCPQCGQPHGPCGEVRADTPVNGPTPPTAPGSARPPGSRYRAARRLVPKSRHPYWLCALYQRTG
jgi:SAM-dependent methyltransferase